MASRRRGLLAACLILACAGCASTADDPDPWEGFNRSMFAFNEVLDEYAYEPLGEGWAWLVPPEGQAATARAVDNLAFPMRFVNSLLQAKGRAAATELGRFVVNTTAGVLGLWDRAAEWGLPAPEPEDLGQTLGAWGLGPGPYLVVPFLGPYDLRDLAGSVGDWATPGMGLRYSVPVFAVGTVNWRARNDQRLDDLREDAFDFYAAVRDAYLQKREALVTDGASTTSEETEDDLYFPDEEGLEDPR